VTALDASARRLERLHENLARTGLAAEVIAADALQWQPEGSYDAVLLDAPCTATGTCRRHPDVLHRTGSRQIAEMADLQERLLERAAGWLTPGGTLVYAVCSLEQEEGEAQARRVALTPDPIAIDGFASTSEGWLRTDPAMIEGGMDGFFIARWRR
jgi:16S rRNA (cytosine967-C5)-methyltransferase